MIEFIIKDFLFPQRTQVRFTTVGDREKSSPRSREIFAMTSSAVTRRSSVDDCPLRIELLKEVQMKKKGNDRNIRWKYYVAVGTEDGKIGLGVRCSGDKSKAFNRAVSNAKRSMMRISRGCFNEDNGKMHTVSRPVIARWGSQRIEIDPAPRGTSIANPLARVMFRVAGIEDCVIRISLEDVPLGSLALALFHSLKTLKQRRL